MNPDDKCSRPNRIRKRINFSRTYGLRPRTEIRRPSYECDLDEKDVIVERKPPRSRGRNPLMTKYRRKTANERERHRMKEINDAFTTLRGILPVVYTKRSSQVSMTKIRILKLAASYIEALSDLLSDNKRPHEEKSIERDPFSCTSCVNTQSATPTLETPSKQGAMLPFPFDKLQQENQNVHFSDCLTEGKNSKLKGGADDNLEMVVNPYDCDIFSLLGDVAAIEGSVNKWEIGGAIDDFCLSLT